jgi:tetratricopeptide (TPR) repeat protein
MGKSILLFTAVFAIGLNSFANEKATQAYEAYQQRDYSQAGTKKVEEAITLFAEAIALESDPVQLRELKVAQTSAYYFLGTAINDKNAQLAAHESAMSLSDSLMEEMGVDSEKAHELSQTEITQIKNSLDENEELTLAEAMYSKGISLSQWGKLKGISSSIGRLPEVLGLMDRIEMMGYESIHEYGPYRTIGRINFVLPKLFGGDLKKSEQYLKDAYRNTLPEGEQYSTNGYNNIYLAETLHKLGKENQAIRLLETFVAADFSTLADGNEPENREALRIAEELIKDWK